MVLVCNDPNSAAQVIDGLPTDMAHSQRIPALRKAQTTDFTSLQKSHDYQVASRVLSEFYANQ
jgi:beta-N-acetylhexosaminidase